MTDTQSGSQEPETANDDRQDRLLKSLIAVYKDNRDVLSYLPDILERCLDKKPVNPNLAKAGHKQELDRDDDLERLAYRKRSDMEKKLEYLEEDIESKSKRITNLDQTIKDMTGTIEALKSEENAVLATKDRRLTERELKKKDKQLEASEKRVKDLEEENLKLKGELENKGKEISETRKLQEEKKSTEQRDLSEQQVKGLEEENLRLKRELEKKGKEISESTKLQEEKLLKREEDLQQMYDEYDKAVKTHKSSYDSLISELSAKDEKIQEYIQSLSKMREDLKKAHTKMDLYKSRLASLSEKRVKQDQRLVEDTLGSNRQSELERDFSAFFDEDRMDACEKMQSIYLNKGDDYLFIYYPRLACIIFETAYEQVKEAKEAASDLFKELIKVMINFAPHMGIDYSNARKAQLQVCSVPLNVNTWSDGSECSKDTMDAMMLSLKEAAPTCDLSYFVESVKAITLEKWTTWCKDDASCMFTPAWHLVQGLDKYIQACIRLTWRMVNQVPPMKLEFHCSKFKKSIHKNIGYHNNFKRHTRNTRTADGDQDEEIACYLWPGLQDGGGRLIRAGEVICKVEEP